MISFILGFFIGALAGICATALLNEASKEYDRIFADDEEDTDDD